MSIYNYVVKTHELERELHVILPSKEVDMLREELQALGINGWYAWTEENLKEILSYIAATPSARNKKKKWQQPPFRRWVVPAAIHYLRNACNLLEGIESHWLFPGNSYREMAKKAAFAYLDIFYVKENPDWPFDPPDPFQKRD